MSTPGTNRPMNLVDVLNAIVGQSDSLGTQSTGGSVVGIGIVAEVDESVTPVSDAAITGVSTPTTWDNGVWNAFAWS